MKRIIVLLLTALMLAGGIPAAALAAPDATPPISKGKINKVTKIYWGKSEMFPVLATVWPDTQLDVYEYDETWVLVLYDTWISQGTQGQNHSFYGYVKRSDITCDPALEDDQSDKADTGPGKRKGKKPKPQQTPGGSAQASPGESAEPTSEPSPEPTVPVEEMEEYDWIIRTPGICKIRDSMPGGADYTVSFSLLAQKFGGWAPSSDPTYNKNLHNPYVATAVVSIVSKMSDLLDKMGASGYMQGSGGVSIEYQAPTTQFFLDTGAEDPALVNFTVHTEATAVLNPNITTDTVQSNVKETRINMPGDLQIQLRKAGSGYQFVLKNVKPGGGDLTFPAVLEKTFSDPNRWDKEAKKADEQRKKAEELRKELLEKIRKSMQDEYNKAQQSSNPADTADATTTEEPLAPLVTEEPLAPLVSEEPLAPLVSEEPVAPLVSEDPLAPLVPQPGENVSDFPGGM